MTGLARRIAIALILLSPTGLAALQMPNWTGFTDEQLPRAVHAIAFEEGVLTATEEYDLGGWTVFYAVTPPVARLACPDDTTSCDTVELFDLRCRRADGDASECSLYLGREEDEGTQCTLNVAGGDAARVECPAAVNLQE